MGQFAVNEAGIAISVKTHCIAALTLSKYGKNCREYQLFRQLISDCKMMSKIEKNSIFFRQILRAFANLKLFDEAWQFYEEKVGQNEHDLAALILICEFEQRTDKLLQILDIIRRHFCFEELSRLDLYLLVALHRIAIQFPESIFCNELRQQLDAHLNGQINENIVAKFELFGTQWLIANGADSECRFASMDKTDQIIKQSEYEFDCHVNNEIPNEIARQMHLKYHAEKKALSVLLFEQKQAKVHKISVSIPMCRDCHNFFAKMSNFYECEIECVDPSGTHLFKNGFCSLCDL